MLRNHGGEISEVVYRSPYAYAAEATDAFEWSVPASRAKDVGRGQKLVSEEFHLQFTSSPLRLYYYPKGANKRQDGTCAVYVLAGTPVPDASLQLSVNGSARMLRGRWIASSEHKGYRATFAQPMSDATLRLEMVQAKPKPEQATVKVEDETRRKPPKSPSHRREVLPVAVEACPGGGVGSLDEVPVAPAPAAVLCPEGHPMLPCENARHKCDVCGSKGTSFRCMLGCDYDMCTECNHLGQGPPVMPLELEPQDDSPYSTSEEAKSYAHQRPHVPDGCIIRLNVHGEGVQERIMGTSPLRPHSDVPDHAHFVL